MNSDYSYNQGTGDYGGYGYSTPTNPGGDGNNSAINTPTQETFKDTNLSDPMQYQNNGLHLPYNQAIAMDQYFGPSEIGGDLERDNRIEAMELGFGNGEESWGYQPNGDSFNGQFNDPVMNQQGGGGGNGMNQQLLMGQRARMEQQRYYQQNQFNQQMQQQQQSSFGDSLALQVQKAGANNAMQANMMSRKNSMGLARAQAYNSQAAANQEPNQGYPFQSPNPTPTLTPGGSQDRYGGNGYNFNPAMGNTNHMNSLAAMQALQRSNPNFMGNNQLERMNAMAGGMGSQPNHAISPIQAKSTFANPNLPSILQGGYMAQTNPNSSPYPKPGPSAADGQNFSMRHQAHFNNFQQNQTPNSLPNMPSNFPGNMSAQMYSMMQQGHPYMNNISMAMPYPNMSINQTQMDRIGANGPMPELEGSAKKKVKPLLNTMDRTLSSGSMEPGMMNHQQKVNELLKSTNDPTPSPVPSFTTQVHPQAFTPTAQTPSSTSQQPMMQKNMTQQPMTQQSIAQQSMVQQSIVQQAIAQQTIAQRSVAQQPSPNKLTTKPTPDPNVNPLTDPNQNLSLPKLPDGSYDLQLIREKIISDELSFYFYLLQLTSYDFKDAKDIIVNNNKIFLYQFFRTVVLNGGVERVGRKREWNKVKEGMGLDIETNKVASKLKPVYTRYLAKVETWLFPELKAGIKPYNKPVGKGETPVTVTQSEDITEGRGSVSMTPASANVSHISINPNDSLAPLLNPQPTSHTMPKTPQSHNGARLPPQNPHRPSFQHPRLDYVPLAIPVETFGGHDVAVLQDYYHASMALPPAIPCTDIHHITMALKSGSEALFGEAMRSLISLSSDRNGKLDLEMCKDLSDLIFKSISEDLTILRNSNNLSLIVKSDESNPDLGLDLRPKDSMSLDLPMIRLTSMTLLLSNLSFFSPNQKFLAESTDLILLLLTIQSDIMIDSTPSLSCRKQILTILSNIIEFIDIDINYNDEIDYNFEDEVNGWVGLLKVIYSFASKGNNGYYQWLAWSTLVKFALKDKHIKLLRCPPFHQLISDLLSCCCNSLVKFNLINSTDGEQMLVLLDCLTKSMVKLLAITNDLQIEVDLNIQIVSTLLNLTTSFSTAAKHLPIIKAKNLPTNLTIHLNHSNLTIIINQDRDEILQFLLTTSITCTQAISFLNKHYSNTNLMAGQSQNIAKTMCHAPLPTQAYTNLLDIYSDIITS